MYKLYPHIYIYVSMSLSLSLKARTHTRTYTHRHTHTNIDHHEDPSHVEAFRKFLVSARKKSYSWTFLLW